MKQFINIFGIQPTQAELIPRAPIPINGSAAKHNLENSQRLCSAPVISAAFIALTALITTSALAEDSQQDADARAEYIRSHYAKYEYSIPMRDGKKLFTAVYTPYNTAKPYPFLMTRTPYTVGPYGLAKYKKTLGPSEEFEKEGYIFVFQDVRGKFRSEGTFVNMRPQDAYTKGKNAVDDATDTYDTIEWLIKNVPNNNKKVGMWGVSYPGYYTSVGTINAHPALVAVSPQAPIADWFFDDFHRNGAFSITMAFTFFDFFDKKREGLYQNWPERENLKTPDGYQFFRDLGPLSNVNKNYFKGERPFWNEVTEHPNYDEYWKARNVLPHLKKTKPAALVVGGWYDTEDLYGPLETYRTMLSGAKKERVKLVMGPWYHGEWVRGKGDKLGDTSFGFETTKWFQEQVLLPFFNHHLKSKDNPSLAAATVFETGANRWRQFDSWPPKNMTSKTLYLDSHEQLRSSPPVTTSSASDYVSDPNKPVPYTKEVTTWWSKNYMAEDQRFTAQRPDVLVFETDVLTEDLTIAGSIDLDLWVSTSQSAADWVVKLVDVHPGYNPDDEKVDQENGNLHSLVRWGILRGRFREGMSTPKPFEPGKPTQVKFELYDLLHTFQRGHKLQIQIQSSLFPFIDRNPQKYVDNIFHAKPEDFVKATHKVYHNRSHQSALRFKTIE